MTSHYNYLKNDLYVLSNNRDQSETEYTELNLELEKSKMNFDLIIRLKKGQDEITDEHGPQAYIEESLLIDKPSIEILNDNINSVYQTKVAYLNTAKDHKEIANLLQLENMKTELTKHQIELKLRYLKLTRVTKKIQEIVTGREEIDQQQILLIYDQKKRNLEDNKNKRIETMQAKLEEIKTEIEKKKKENLDFTMKLSKLHEDVSLKEQIILLDSDEKGYVSGDDNNQNTKKK